MGRVATGWQLAKRSLAVVRGDGSLSVLVALGGIASGAVALAFLIPAAVAYGIEETWLAAVIGAVGVYLSTLVATYFAVALAAAAAEVLDGRDATVRGGTAVASQHLGAIAGWALVLTTVNLVLQALRGRSGILGSFLLGAATVAWSLATFLVVPILALEGLGPLAALERSSSLFRQRWGEQLVGTASIGILFAVLGAVPAVVLVALGLASGSVAVAVALVVVAVLVVVAAGVLGSAAPAVRGRSVPLRGQARRDGAVHRARARERRRPEGVSAQIGDAPGSVVRSWASLAISPGGIRSAAVVRT